MNHFDLWHAIYDLYELLIKKENREESYQEYFERHGVVFRALGFDAHQSYEKKSKKRLPVDVDRGFTPEPDFLCVTTSTGLLTIFELKTPFVTATITDRKDGNRKKLNAKVESYISQATEYADSIREHEGARSTVMRDLGVKKITSYEICLIYGLEQVDDHAETSRLLSNRKLQTRILPFDTLLGQLVKIYGSGRPNTEGRDGLCVVYHLIIHPEQACEKTFIADHGEERANRFSICVEREYIFFRAIDATGSKHELHSKITFNEPLFLRFEFSYDDAGIYMSLNVNNEERDLRAGSVKFEFYPDIRSMYVGASLLGRDCARFQMLESYYLTKTMTIEHKLGSFDYFKTRMCDSPSAVDFDGTTFLVREPSGSLVQHHSTHPPDFRKSAGYSRR